jgi:hypothetical protein
MTTRNLRGFASFSVGSKDSNCRSAKWASADNPICIGTGMLRSKLNLLYDFRLKLW